MTPTTGKIGRFTNTEHNSIADDKEMYRAGPRPHIPFPPDLTLYVNLVAKGAPKFFKTLDKEMCIPLLAENNPVYVLRREFCQSVNMYFNTQGGCSHGRSHISPPAEEYPERGGNRIRDQAVNPGEWPLADLCRANTGQTCKYEVTPVGVLASHPPAPEST